MVGEPVLQTCIRHGDLVITFNSDKTVQLVRQSNAQGIVLSYSEWLYVMKVSELHEWPIAPPGNPIPEIDQ